MVENLFFAEGNTCSDDQFRCGSGQFIEMSRKCDFVTDCLDRTDELNCPKGSFCISNCISYRNYPIL